MWREIKNQVYIYNSSNNYFVLNNINCNSNNGIILNKSHNNTLSLNLLQNNRYKGLFLKNSNSNDIVGNSIDNHTYAIYLDNSNYNFISHNDGILNNHTIFQVNCDGNIFIDNFEDNLGQLNKNFLIVDFTVVFLISVLALLCSFIYHKIISILRKE